MRDDANSQMILFTSIERILSKKKEKIKDQLEK